jgi:hypothetical protein
LELAPQADVSEPLLAARLLADSPRPVARQRGRLSLPALPQALQAVALQAPQEQEDARRSEWPAAPVSPRAPGLELAPAVSVAQAERWDAVLRCATGASAARLDQARGQAWSRLAAEQPQPGLLSQASHR